MIAEEDLRHGMRMVKPSAMREVAIEVPQVRRGQLATCRKIFILLLDRANLCQMNSFGVVRSQEVRKLDSR